jgi:hypothetical protein
LFKRVERGLPRDVVRVLLPRREALREAEALAEVLREAWADRRVQVRGSPERALAEAVVRDLVERLRRLPPIPLRDPPPPR